MTKTLALLAAVVGALSFAVSAQTGAARTAACTPGVKPFAGAQARTFCGPAKATLHAGAKTFTVRGGTCDRTSGSVTVNIGTIVIGSPSKTKPEYFGLTVGRILGSGKPAAKDGTYGGAAVSAVHLGKTLAVGTAKVTLAGGRTHGTFAGRLVFSTTTVTGSFTC